MDANKAILLLIFIIIAIICSIALIKSKTIQEGFSLAAENRFLKEQENTFWNMTNKVLMTNFGLKEDMKKVNLAFTQTDTFGNNKNAKTDVSRYFMLDNLPGQEEQNQVCTNALEPKFLPTRENKHGKGCGWWFVKDPDRPSVGSMGTDLGPFKDSELQSTHPGGIWMWDVLEAQRKEDEKRCKKIKSCDMADLVPGKCGFCVDTSSGVPVTAKGLALYPDDPNLSCDSQIVTNHLNCPKPPPPGPPPGSPPGTPPPIPPLQLCDPNPGTGKLSNECLISLAKGTGCTTGGAIISILSGDPLGYYNQPGEENEKFSIALQTIKDGTGLTSPPEYFGQGTCTRADALGYYNSIVKISAGSPSPRAKAAAGFLATGAFYNECDMDPGTQGPFVLHCLQVTAREAGCQPDGSDYPAQGPKPQPRNIPKICGRLGKPSSDGNIRLYVKQECDKLDGNFHGNGECTKKEGGSYSWDCRELNISDTGPTSTKDKYDQMDWGGVIKYFRDLYNNMHSSDLSTVVSASKRCLGVEINVPEPDCADVKGVYYYCYKWNYDYNTASGSVPKSFYYGRFVKTNMIEISNNGPYTPFDIGTDRIFLRVKGLLKQDSGAITTRFWNQTDDGITMSIDGKIVLQKYFDQGPTAYETPNFILSSEKELPYEINWYNNYGGYVLVSRIFINNTFIKPPSHMLKLNQPTGYPFARWDFYEGTIDDRCGTLASQAVGSLPTVTIDGKKCIQFTGPNYLQITNGISMSAFKSITMMVYLKSAAAGWPRLWEFNNTPLEAYNPGQPRGTNGWCSDALFGCMSANNSLGVGFYAKKNCGGPEKWSVPETLPVGKWVHIAFTIDDTYDKLSVFTDGLKAFSQTGASSILNKNKTYSNFYIANSVEFFDKNIAIAWFRMFDYTLTQKDVDTDRMNKFSSDKYYKTTSSSGW